MLSASQFNIRKLRNFKVQQSSRHLKRNNILAHRGLWTDPTERNSRAALSAALNQGFGIETDFRDCAGRLFVSHDPVDEFAQPLLASQFFSDYKEFGLDGRLALNIKADGLQKDLETLLEIAGVPVENVYAFDMSVPDALGYLQREFPLYTRASEYEPLPAFLDRSQGIWIDDFTGEFPQVSKAMEYLESGYRVALVSPELHGRSPDSLWEKIKSTGINQNPKLELCTDYPLQAFELLGTDK